MTSPDPRTQAIHQLEKLRRNTLMFSLTLHPRNREALDYALSVLRATPQEENKADARLEAASAGETVADLRDGQRFIIVGTVEEIDWVRHAASLKHMPLQEYVKRAVNKQLRREGVDAVLFAEECPECGESLAVDLKGYWCETCEDYTVVDSGKV